MSARTGRDYYAILEVPEAASDEQIKRAYRRLALRHHPDRNPGDRRAEERFKEISQAYAVLMDRGRRGEYDRVRRGPAHGAASGDATWREEDLFRDLFTDPRTASVFRDLAQEWARMGFRFNDAFVRDLFFGGRAVVIIDPAGIRGAGSGGRRARVDRVRSGTTPYPGGTAVFPVPFLAGLWSLAKELLRSPWRVLRGFCALPNAGRRRGELEYDVLVSAEELRQGGRCRVTIERLGRTEELVVRIPPGLRVGTRLRLRGKGEARADGTAGDLFLRVRSGV